jgi:imidazolonepropionase-like amidohydrolase
MRLPIERDKCQAKLDILIEGFMRADWTAYSDAAAWLRDFAHQKNIERGRVMCGGNWFTPQQIEAMRESARKRATRVADRRPGSSSK